ncbi:hypothetical protein PG984_005414 [Apiospora sp. TS-2023a]
MADNADQWQKPLARDVAEYSDAKLDECLEKSKGRHGMYVIDVSDPENLADSVINRLRERANAPARPQVIDLDQVTARLLATPATRPATTRRDRSPTAPLPPPGSAERRDYEELIRAGGRPCYSIEKLDDLMNNPRAYREVLRPWVHNVDMNRPEWEVFGRQLSNWKGFRGWQKAYMDDSSKMAHRAIGNALKQFQPLHHQIPHLSSYGEALDILQARQYVRVHRPNAEEQNGLSTWYDYIAYTCHRCAQRATSLERLQPEFKEAWTGLKEAVVLKPFETLEYIRTEDAKLQHNAALRGAARDLEAAKLALSKLVPSDFDPSDLEASRMRVPLPKRRLLAASVKRQKSEIDIMWHSTLESGITRIPETISNGSLDKWTGRWDSFHL